MDTEKLGQETGTPSILKIFSPASLDKIFLPTFGLTLRIVVFACLVLLSFGSSSAQELPPDGEVLVILQERLDEGRAIGFVVGLYESGKLPRIVTAGEPGEGARPFSDRSVFEIGSITKVLTASLLMEMAERGEVSLTDPVSDYLPERVHMPSHAGRKVTFLDLATHRAGLPVLPDNLEPADRANPYVDYTIEKLYEFLSEFKIEKEIGAEFEYSNVGFGLLGHVLTLVADKKYEDLLRQRILDPLGMINTGIHLEGEARNWLVKGHDKYGNEVTPIDIPPSLIGAGGFRSDVRDMLQFLAVNIEEPDPDLKKILHTMHEPQGEVFPGQMSVGIGWLIRDAGESRIVWHNGYTGYFHSFIGFDPDRKVGVVILANSDHDPDDIGFHLLNPELPLVEAPVERTAITVPEEILAQYVGEYELGPGFSIVITMENEKLFLQATGQPRVPIFPESNTSFFLEAVDAQVTFTRDDGENVTGLILYQGGMELPAPKIR
jgi:serine-type D-Ala-D-Ala carboxypeptidase/endopeptidase